MRREGYELSIGKPRVITREVDGVTEEPFEIAGGRSSARADGRR